MSDASEIVVRLAKDDEDLKGILALQRLNHEDQLSKEEVDRDGFLTARHDLELLRRMHAANPSAIATHQGRVVAYVIMMSREFRDALPILVPMFQVFDALVHRDRPLSEQRYFVNGQSCVDKAYRGLKLLDRIFALYREVYNDRFDLIATEIAQRNVRSLRAHARVGFRTVHAYVDPVTKEPWDVVLWDWR
jgi:hypothetical protein